MTQQHREALHRAVHSHTKMREAVMNEAQRLADERAAASEREMALRTEINPQQREEKKNG